MTGLQAILFFCGYRKRDSNPHKRNAQGILSPSCLPFHHFGSLALLSKKRVAVQKKKFCWELLLFDELFSTWLRGQDSNMRPPGYEPGELPTAPPRDVHLQRKRPMFFSCGYKGRAFREYGKTFQMFFEKKLQV